MKLALVMMMLACAVSASAEPGMPALQVRAIPLRGNNNSGTREIFELSLICPEGMPAKFLCIDVVSELRRWPYRDGDTYYGSGVREVTSVMPKVEMRIKVDGEWKQLPATQEATYSVPRFAPLAAGKQIKLGGTGIVKGKLNEVEVELTQRNDSGEAKALTLSWKAPDPR